MRARWHKIKKRLEIKKEKKARMEEGKELRKEGWRIHNSDFFFKHYIVFCSLHSVFHVIVEGTW